MAIEAEALCDAGTPIKILYRNWRGETAVRSITNGLIRSDEDGGTQLGMSVWFGSTEWHPEPQWFLRAADVEKSAYRDFAMADILAWGGDAIARHRSALAEDTARAAEGAKAPNSDLADRLMATAVDIAKAEISARFHGGSFEEIETVGRQKQRMVHMLERLVSSPAKPPGFIETLCTAEDMRKRAVKVAEDWIAVFGARDPKHVSAQTWAGDAVRDIAEAIRALPLTPEAADANR